MLKTLHCLHFPHRKYTILIIHSHIRTVGCRIGMAVAVFVFLFLLTNVCHLRRIYGTTNRNTSAIEDSRVHVFPQIFNQKFLTVHRHRWEKITTNNSMTMTVVEWINRRHSEVVPLTNPCRETGDHGPSISRIMSQCQWWKVGGEYLVHCHCQKTIRCDVKKSKADGWWRKSTKTRHQIVCDLKTNHLELQVGCI